MYSEKYRELTDEEIIQLIRAQDHKAIDYIMEKYKNLVRQKARTLFLIGGDKDDLIQEGMIGLYKAIHDFKKEKDNSFYNFAHLCISRQIYSAIKASNRKKNSPLNNYISLYTPAYNENSEQGESGSLIDLMISNNKLNPEEMIIDKENVSVIEYELGNKLSAFEREVLEFYIEGLKYMQIAEKMGKEPKSIDNALQRIKGKLNQVLKELK
jgi:RNA polymerase sporulation-specific sigma factor